MTRGVNLLPWRVEQRQRERRRVLALMAGAPILAAAAVVGAWLQIGAWQSAQEARNAYLERAIEQVDQRLTEVSRLRDERERIEGRLAVLEKLVARRGRPLEWLNALVQATPPAVVLKRLETEGAALEVAGRAGSNAEVSRFMNALEATAVFDAPRLEVIEEREASGYRFRLQIPQVTAEAQQGGPDGAE